MKGINSVWRRLCVCFIQGDAAYLLNLLIYRYWLIIYWTKKKIPIKLATSQQKIYTRTRFILCVYCNLFCLFYMQSHNKIYNDLYSFKLALVALCCNRSLLGRLGSQSLNVSVTNSLHCPSFLCLWHRKHCWLYPGHQLLTLHIIEGLFFWQMPRKIETMMRNSLHLSPPIDYKRNPCEKKEEVAPHVAYKAVPVGYKMYSVNTPAFTPQPRRMSNCWSNTREAHLYVGGKMITVLKPIFK